MPEKILLNLPEAAQLLGLTPRQLYECTRERSQSKRAIPLPTIRLGKRVCFRREALIAWLIANETGGAR